MYGKCEAKPSILVIVSELPTACYMKANAIERVGKSALHNVFAYGIEILLSDTYYRNLEILVPCSPFVCNEYNVI
ncbi:MAG: hypothetical protein EFT35_10100 [Methanophagales archaeon ANME-1-THS]|nr:MAG: hypothetical protein EFT35_10100 [Methanophagales archaeon ANME-1-THS]